MKRNSFYDINKFFLRGFTVRDIAEPLASFDFETHAETFRAAMRAEQLEIADVRKNGFVTGYIELQELGNGLIGNYCHPIGEARILSGHASLSDLVITLNQVPYLYVNIN